MQNKENNGGKTAATWPSWKKKKKEEGGKKNGRGEINRNTSGLKSQSQCNSHVRTLYRSNRHNVVPSHETETQKSKKPITPML